MTASFWSQMSHLIVSFHNHLSLNLLIDSPFGGFHKTLPFPSNKSSFGNWTILQENVFIIQNTLRRQEHSMATSIWEGILHVFWRKSRRRLQIPVWRKVRLYPVKPEAQRIWAWPLSTGSSGLSATSLTVPEWRFSSVHLTHVWLWPHGLQHTRLSCPSPTPEACSNSCPSSQWCHPTISSSVVPFSCLQSFPAPGSFPVSQFFASGGLSIGASASASVLPVSILDWFPLGWTGLISL